MANISSIRTDYKLDTLSDKQVLLNPFDQFEKWWQEAQQKEITEMNAMALSTVDIQTLLPNTRIVLLKDYSEQGFTFFTNYESNKGKEIARNHNGCLLFFWKELERQIKIQGIIKKTNEELSNQYFSSRPNGSKISAWASQQSSKIESREFLEKKYEEIEKKYENNIPKPPHWGGYILEPLKIEFWQGRSSRLHDRICFERKNIKTTEWNKFRLAP